MPEKTLSNRRQRRGGGRIGIVVDRIERGLAPVVAQRCQVVAKCISELAGVLHHRRRSGAVSFDTTGDSRSLQQASAGRPQGRFHQDHGIGDRQQAEQITAKVRPGGRVGLVADRPQCLQESLVHEDDVVAAHDTLQPDDGFKPAFYETFAGAWICLASHVHVLPQRPGYKRMTQYPGLAGQVIYCPAPGQP